MGQLLVNHWQMVFLCDFLPFAVKWMVLVFLLMGMVYCFMWAVDAFVASVVARYPKSRY